MKEILIRLEMDKNTKDVLETMFSEDKLQVLTMMANLVKPAFRAKILIDKGII